MKLTNISGSGELWIHSYYTKKEFAKAATQLTIDGDIREDGSGLKVKIIPYICRDIKLGSYTEADADDISALTITGGKPSVFQKLANMPKAATENIEIYYSAENTLKKAEETVYKYEKGLYLRLDQDADGIAAMDAIRSTGKLEADTEEHLKKALEVYTRDFLSAKVTA